MAKVRYHDGDDAVDSGRVVVLHAQKVLEVDQPV